MNMYVDGLLYRLREYAVDKGDELIFQNGQEWHSIEAGGLPHVPQGKFFDGFVIYRGMLGVLFSDNMSRMVR